MLLGLTLPLFRGDPGPALEVASRAERSGVDGVFAFDHLQGRRPGRPALEVACVLGAAAAETSRVTLGPLVVRASLRHPATLVASLDTLSRICGPRLVAGIGSGDEESRLEDQAFGLEVPATRRLPLARAAVEAAAGRGYPVWLGGNSPGIRRLATDAADGWNAWEMEAERFAGSVSEVRQRATSPDFACSWGGLVLVGATETEARSKVARLSPRPGVLCGGPERLAEQLLHYREATADWVILAPVDPDDAENPSILGELVRPLLA